MDKDVLAAVIADNEAKSLLGIEELHDALSLADNLGRHSASSAAAAESAAAATAAAEATAAAAAAAEATAPAAIAAATASTAAAEAATITESAAEAAAVSKTSLGTCELIPTKTVALVTAATTAVTLTPSIETHGNPNSLVPRNQKNQRAGPVAQPAERAESSARTARSVQEKWQLS
jgi:hypothetical protein